MHPVTSVQSELSPAQVALAWVLAQGRHVVPIPGTKTPKYLADNAQPPTSSCARRTWPSSTCYPRLREPATDLLTPSQLSIDPACQVTSRRNEPLRIDGHNLKHSAHGGTTDLHNLVHR